MPKSEQEKVLKFPTNAEVMQELDEILDETVGAVIPLTAEEYTQHKNLLDRFKGGSVIRDVQELGVNQKFYLIYVDLPDRIVIHQFVVVAEIKDQGKAIRVEARPLDTQNFERIVFPPNQPVLIDVR